jgi:hypothetical protein
MLYKEKEEQEEAHKLLNSKLKRLRTRLSSVDDSTFMSGMVVKRNV